MRNSDALTLPHVAALPRVPAVDVDLTGVREGMRNANRAAGIALVILACLLWAMFLRPQALGGRAGYVLVSGTSMEPHYHTGDMVFVEHYGHYHAGQVIAYRVPKGDPMAGSQVIHRIIGGDGKHGFVVQGDNRTAADVWRPKDEDIVGAKVTRIPHAILLLQYLRSPLLIALLAACFVFVRVLTPKAAASASA
jgi:signal peptidase I